MFGRKLRRRIAELESKLDTYQFFKQEYINSIEIGKKSLYELGVLFLCTDVIYHRQEGKMPCDYMEKLLLLSNLKQIDSKTDQGNQKGNPGNE